MEAGLKRMHDMFSPSPVTVVGISCLPGGNSYYETIEVDELVAGYNIIRLSILEYASFRLIVLCDHVQCCRVGIDNIDSI